MSNDNTGATLRETVEASFDRVMEATGEAAPVEPVTTETQTEAAAPEKPEKPSRTAGRPRDEAGRLLPGKPDKNAAASEPKPDTAKPDTGAPSAAAAPKREPIRIRDKDVEWWQYPSAWKADNKPHWDALPDAVRQEIHRREQDAAFGVSTYKAEYDQVKPLKEALAPYEPFLRQANMRPEQYVSALVQAEQSFRYGNEQQKLATLAQWIQDYNIPVQNMFVRGEDGQVYFNQQFQKQQQAQQPQGITPQQVEQLVQQKVQQVQLQAAVQQFATAKDREGNPIYPHFDTVKQTMDGILRAGLAQDLPSAYDAALRLPQHAALYDAQQNAKREAEDAAKAKAKAEQTQRAKQANVSTKSSAPTGNVVTADKGRKGLRATIEDAAEAVLGGGRV